MTHTITVGLDGSPESRAAAEWAAREAEMRDVPVRILHVWEQVPDPMAQAPLLGAETQQHWSVRIPRDFAEGLRLRHPGVEVTAEHADGRPGEVLCRAAKDTGLLVLGSRGLSGIGGFLVGSVGSAVVAHADCPVVLVRAGEQATDEHGTDLAGNPSAATGYRPVVLGLDVGHVDASVLDFAFDEAVLRDTGVRVVHGWTLPPYYLGGPTTDLERYDQVAHWHASALGEVLNQWRRKYPSVEAVAEFRTGSAASLLVDASGTASLVVVGRRIRSRPFGAHIGSVTHAVLHHATAPVAVVAHT